MSERLPSPSAEYFFERSPWNHKWALFGTGLVMSGFDFLAGPIVFFPIMFIIPVALMAWNCGLRTALWLGAILCIVRFGFQCYWGVPYELPVAIVNAFSRLGVLLLITFLVGKLSQKTKALRARVRTLEGILPTCCFCKDIRDSDGHWHQIEEYVTTHSEARFSHGVCPDCASKHYGSLLNNPIGDTAPAIARAGALQSS